jgi:hypothetical protein
MTRLLMILDTWLMMILATVFLWFGMTSIRAGNVAGSDVGIGLLGGVAGVCSAGLLCRWRGPWTQHVLIVLRLSMIACLAYFAWFQERPWFALDDSALVRGSFRQEFLLQRLEQVGGFLLVTVPLVVLGIWHGRLLPQMSSRSLGDRAGVVSLVGLVGASVVAGVAARLVGIPTMGPIFWAVSALAVVLLLFEFARRVNRAEFPAFIAFAVFAIAMPVVLLWP